MRRLRKGMRMGSMNSRGGMLRVHAIAGPFYWGTNHARKLIAAGSSACNHKAFSSNNTSLYEEQTIDIPRRWVCIRRNGLRLGLNVYLVV